MNFAETEKTELKQKLTDALTKEIVAFLNADGGAIYIGVNDDGSVCGVKKLDECLKKIADILESQILPDPRACVELGTKFIDGKHIVEVKVRKGQGLYYIKKYGRSAQGCFVRVGSTSRSMTEDQINSAHNRYLLASAKITEIASDIEKPTFQYLKLMLAEKGFSVNEKTFAKNLHLLTKDGQFNKMAELLADKNEVSIKVVRFKGKSKADGIALRNEYGEKCLVLAMKQAFDYCADVINETRTSFSKGVRKDSPLFDRDAFREVWFNACLHNNWADGTPPAIYIFTNRMEIISTGGLPANLSKEDFYMGVSKPVNEELAKLFIRLDLMEQTGHGIPLVTERYGKKAFSFLDFFLRVTIPFEFELESDANSDTQGDTQGDTQETAFDDWIESQIRKNSKITTEELSKLSGKSVITIKRHIARLSHIKYVGSGYSGHWEIVE
ncbi:MAG: putative DNA binding domain-containing protein [Treponema sp.]|nr:putative DNA binding domain-containing protein [Treponema sp.]